MAKVDCEPAFALADGRRVEQIVSNLLSNAARHSGSHITVSCQRRADRVLVTVADDGRGIPAGQEESVFEPYHSPPGQVGVTSAMGRGLFVARTLARLMQGELSVRSEDGTTAFVLDLPAATASEPSVRLKRLRKAVDLAG